MDKIQEFTTSSDFEKSSVVAVVGQQEELESGDVTIVGSDSSVPDLPHFSIENWAKSDSSSQEPYFPSDFASGLEKKVWLNEEKAEAWNSLPPVSIMISLHFNQ